MKKSVLSVALVILMSSGFVSCKDKPENKLEQLEEKLEQRSENLEDASEEIGDAADDLEDALESLKEALKEVTNQKDRDAIRLRVNEIFDDMKLEMELAQ